MIDEILVELFGEMVFGRLSRSRRAQLLFRVFFGLLGAGLGVFGAVHFVRGGQDLGGNSAMRASMIAMFVFLASFSLFNIALGRKWQWPGIGFVVSFVALFASRLIFGV
jgi:hypothetical protein